MVLGSIQYQAYVSMAQQLMTEYRWTSTCLIYDSTRSPFFAIASDYIERGMRRSANKLAPELVSFPVDLLAKYDFAPILKKIELLSRGEFSVIDKIRVNNFVLLKFGTLCEDI